MLRKLIPQQADETLRMLAEQGFIEVIGITQDARRSGRRTRPAAPPGRGRAARRPRPAAAAVPPRDFEATRAQAVRLFTDHGRPDGRGAGHQAWSAPASPDELRTLLQTAQRIIGNARGGQAAADYGTRFLDSPRG